MQTETFKDIEWYEGLYQVSDKGNVMRVKSGRVLKPLVDKGGYHRVVLSKEGAVKNYSVHRLVALTFLENPDLKEQVNHIDGVKSNNSLSNLEWNTRSENMIHSRDVLGNMVGEKHYLYGRFWASNPTSKSVIQLTREGVQIKIFWSTLEAQRETGVHQSSISNVCLWKRNTAAGFLWSYS